MTTDVVCHRCNGRIDTDSWIRKGGHCYHVKCCPDYESAEERDAAANIDRLTAQVEELKAELDNEQNKSYQSTVSMERAWRERDEANGRAKVFQQSAIESQAERDEERNKNALLGEFRKMMCSDYETVIKGLQESLTAVEQEREHHNRQRIEAEECVTMQVERARKAEQLVAHLKRECGRLHMAGAALYETYRHDMTNEESERNRVALTIHMSPSSSPLTGAELAEKLGTKPLTRAEFELNLQSVGVRTVDAPTTGHTLDCNEGMTYGDSCSCAPPAETPAPTFKCDSVEQCALHYADGKHVARDASVDAPDWKAIAEQLGDTVDHLRAELADERKRCGDLIAQQAANFAVFDDKIGEVEAKLVAANEEVARLNGVIDNGSETNTDLIVERDGLRAKLGRAVVTFSRYREYGTAWVDAMSETSLTQAKRGAANVRALEAEFDAILADADSKAAGDYVTALEAVYEAARSIRANFPRSRSEWFSEQEELVDALAAVDARLGGGR